MARGFVGALQLITKGITELGETVEDHEKRIAKIEDFHEAVTPALWKSIVKSPMKPLRKPRKR